jgi:hypothetical protein
MKQRMSPEFIKILQDKTVKGKFVKVKDFAKEYELK